MDRDDLGHQENEANLEHALRLGSGKVLGTLALPSTLLSLASGLALVGVFLLLRSTEVLRAALLLPFPPALAAWPAAILAWLVAGRCRSRPGRSRPRVYALGLAALATVVAVAATLPDLRLEPWVHALALTTLAASLALSPRLFKIRAHSLWTERIGPLSLLSVFLLLMPGSCAVGMAAVEGQRRAVLGRIETLEGLTREVRAVAAQPWDGMAAEPTQAKAQVQRLVAVSAASGMDQANPWGMAAALGLEPALSQAVEGAVEAVAAALSSSSAPRTSTLEEPALYWDDASQRWIRSGRFPVLSGAIGSYYRENGRLFAELGRLIRSAPNGMAAALANLHEEKTQALRRQTARLRSSFTDGWAAEGLPALLEGEEIAPLRDLLTTRLLTPPGERSRPPLVVADLRQLLELPLYQARAYRAFDGEGCVFRPDHQARGLTLARIDCAAYQADSGGGGARLRMEVRIVYSSRFAFLYLNQKPSEIYFLIPVPAATEATAFRQAVMTDLASAVRHRGQGDVQARSNDGSFANGFYLVASGSSRPIKVVAATEHFLDNQSAIVVRALIPD